MKIIYIAFSCAPCYGSEARIGWRIPVEASKDNEVTVFTAAGNARVIESYLIQNPIDHLKFYYIDIPPILKKICKGPLFSLRLLFWNGNVQKKIKEIINREDVDVIHQITPVEFRAIGNYGSIKRKAVYVCGPVGGGEYIPTCLKSYVQGKARIIELIRKIANHLAKLQFRLDSRLEKCDELLFANTETQSLLKSLKKNQTHILTEVGIDDIDILNEEKSNSTITFLVAGRLIYRKGVRFLLDALNMLPSNSDYRLNIVGKGPELDNLKTECRKFGLDKHVSFLGAVPYVEMEKNYAEADVLIMPSLRETTGTVLVEALSHGIPIITIDKFGGKTILDEDVAWFYSGSTREEVIISLRDKILNCINNRKDVMDKSQAIISKIEKYTWRNKYLVYRRIYQELLAKCKSSAENTE